MAFCAVFRNNIVLKVLNNIPKYPPFYSFVEILIVSVIPFNISIPEYSRAWTIFIRSSISSFAIISVVFPEPCIFFWILASIADAAAVIPNETKITVANETATSINGLAILLNNEPDKPPNWIVSEILVFDSFILADKLFLSNAFYSLDFLYCFQ